MQIGYKFMFTKRPGATDGAIIMIGSLVASLFCILFFWGAIEFLGVKNLQILFIALPVAVIVFVAGIKSFQRRKVLNSMSSDEKQFAILKEGLKSRSQKKQFETVSKILVSYPFPSGHKEIEEEQLINAISMCGHHKIKNTSLLLVNLLEEIISKKDSSNIICDKKIEKEIFHALISLDDDVAYKSLLNSVKRFYFNPKELDEEKLLLNYFSSKQNEDGDVFGKAYLSMINRLHHLRNTEDDQFTADNKCRSLSDVSAKLSLLIEKSQKFSLNEDFMKWVKLNESYYVSNINVDLAEDVILHIIPKSGVAGLLDIYHYYTDLLNKSKCDQDSLKRYTERSSYALKSMERMGPMKDFLSLLDENNAADPQLRNIAAKKIDTSNPEIRTELKRRLGENMNSSSAAAIVAAFGKSKSQDLLEAVKECYKKTTNLAVLKAALNALIEIGGPVAAEFLMSSFVRYATKEKVVQPKAISAIAAGIIELNPRTISPEIVALLNSEHDIVRKAVTRIIGVNAKVDFISSYLVGLSSDAEEVRKASSEAIESLGKSAAGHLIEHLAKADSGIRGRILSLLVKATSKNFGEDYAEWTAWWAKNK